MQAEPKEVSGSKAITPRATTTKSLRLLSCQQLGHEARSRVQYPNDSSRSTNVGLTKGFIILIALKLRGGKPFLQPRDLILQRVPKLNPPKCSFRNRDLHVVNTSKQEDTVLKTSKESLKMRSFRVTERNVYLQIFRHFAGILCYRNNFLECLRIHIPPQLKGHCTLIASNPRSDQYSSNRTNCLHPSSNILLSIEILKQIKQRRCQNYDPNKSTTNPNPCCFHASGKFKLLHVHWLLATLFPARLPSRAQYVQ